MDTNDICVCFRGYSAPMSLGKPGVRTWFGGQPTALVLHAHTV